MGPIERLIKELTRLPGIGEKTATRLAYQITRWGKNEARLLADAITDVKEKIGLCPVCFNLTENKSCGICSSVKRDKSIICVVEDPQDMQAIEKSGSFGGVYHILHGTLSPLDGIGPDDIRVQELVERLKSGTVKELIIATNPTTAGEATALFIARLVKPFNVKLTRIAFGIPFGGDLEYVDKSTLARSIEHRAAL